MATVYISKRKTRKGQSYPVKYYDPLTRKKKHYKTFQKLREAQQAANALRAALDSGNTPEAQKSRLVPLTFGEIANSLKEEWAERLRINDLARKTHDEYCYRLNVLERQFGEKLLCQIAKREIKKYLNDVTEAFTNVTSNRALSVIRKVFAHGIKINAVVSDLSVDIKFLSEKEHERKNFLLPDQLNRLIEATKKSRAKHYLPAIIFLGAEHGASKQEILFLKWSDIKFDYDEIGIIKLFRTKNTMERIEFLMPRTKKALLQWKKHLEHKRRIDGINKINSDHVFCRINGTPIKNFNKSWWAARREAGIKDFHFHDLRHTFCSNLIMSGSDLKDAKEMIGHSDISMTDRYSHLTALHKRSRQERLAEHYENHK